MNRRTGVTLLEVLIAIFVTAVGLLGLLALFPLGALDMAKAIQYSRSAQCAYNGAAVANFLGIRQDPNIYAPPSPPGVNYYTTPTGWPALSSANGPSYPVFVDPIGVALGSTAIGNGLLPSAPGPTAVPGIPRVAPAAVATTANWTLNFMTLQDEITFQNTGYAVPPNPVAPLFPNLTQSIERDDRYTWG
jgi:Prokaryotic N-terminal methylation motif